MTLPTSIQPKVGPSLITRVTRLYNGTIADCLHELLQNARRAGASTISIDVTDCDEIQTLVIRDDGSGIDDPLNLLTLGQSGWNSAIAAREDPAGMGVFSLAGRHVTVRSWSQSAQAGWQVTIPENGWEGQIPLAIEPAKISVGTMIGVTLSAAWAQSLEGAIKQVARYFPLPVNFRGEAVSREDFLSRAVHVETCHGYRIGVFRTGSRQYRDWPRINFHGVTVPCRHEAVEEADDYAHWSARVEIIDAPALQLVLPARKEMVENEALSLLRLDMEMAIYRAIARQPEHRLSYKSWQRATTLGVDLPDAAAWLNAWAPSVADSTGVPVGHKVSGTGMVIIKRSEADLEQAAASIIGNIDMMGLHAVDAEPEFEGYAWYDRLPRVTAIDFTFQHGGQSWRYGDHAGELLPNDMVSGRVSDLMLELSIAADGAPDSQTSVRTFDGAMLVASNDGYCLDDAIILIAVGTDVDPSDLADLMEASLFCAGDDADCGSWETQNDNFRVQARNLANRLILGDEAALIARLREAVSDHVSWLIPQGRQMMLTASGSTLDLALSDAA